MDLYIDCEWYINQKIFLLGYCFENGKRAQLYDRGLTMPALQNLLDQVKGDYIYFYGPDIGMLEKHFKVSLRDKYNCVNLIRVFRYALPPQKSYKLAELEKIFGIRRASQKYKKSIRKIFKDWNNPKKKRGVLEYNKEDAVNLYLLKKRIFKKYPVEPQAIELMLLC